MPIFPVPYVFFVGHSLDLRGGVTYCGNGWICVCVVLSLFQVPAAARFSQSAPGLFWEREFFSEFGEPGEVCCRVCVVAESSEEVAANL